MRPLALAVAMIAASCSRPSEREIELREALVSGAFVRIAATTVGRDRLEFWHEPRDTHSGPFIIIARDASGRLIDFCGGTFSSSARPYCQNRRFCTLVADRDSGGWPVFFVYDSQEHCFSKYEAHVNHVHEGLLMLGNKVIFASCKTPEPVRQLDLTDGSSTSFGPHAPQDAELHSVGNVVLVAGGRKVYEVVGETLVPSNRSVPPGHTSVRAFDQILDAGLTD